MKEIVEFEIANTSFKLLDNIHFSVQIYRVGLVGVGSERQGVERGFEYHSPVRSLTSLQLQVATQILEGTNWYASSAAIHLPISGSRPYPPPTPFYQPPGYKLAFVQHSMRSALLPVIFLSSFFSFLLDRCNPQQLMLPPSRGG